MLLETFQPRRSALGGPCRGPFKLELPEDPVLGLRCSKRSQQHASDKHRRGPSTPRDQALCHEISLCCAPLRMTVLWGFQTLLGTTETPHASLFVRQSFDWILAGSFQ